MTKRSQVDIGNVTVFSEAERSVTDLLPVDGAPATAQSSPRKDGII